MTTTIEMMDEVIELNDDQGILCVMDATGDTKLIWDRKNKDEVQSAKRTFDELKAKGYIAYSVKKDGSAGEVLSDFDKKAEKLIMVPPLIGG